ncbi:alpha-soluble NSF attachment protein 2-like [Amaranthus tricolor]|uniref:alpha-soluble NSF attachment protein 2-like n=1 Tax=Amaranthus tricolor TaxID=29722 RepID=UPI0025825A4F|nr:alpha-soluble NSF attachment protein 2-like [Amaranthus tricolor]
MVDYMTQNEKCKNKQADNLIGGWKLSGSVSEYAAAEFHQKTGDQAGSNYIELAECHLKTGSIHEAAAAFVDAANCYKKISPIQSISCLEQAVNLFSTVGRLSMAGRYCKEVGEIYEQLRDFEESIKYFEKAAKFFLHESSITSANQCKQKVAQFSAQLKQYTKAIEIFEEIAGEAVNSNLLRYGVRKHLLNAGICHLCRGDLVAVTKALQQYQNMDPTFSRTHENELLTDLVAAYGENDVEKFTEVLKDYDSLSPLDSWKIILLLRVKEDLKAKEGIVNRT